MLTSSLSSTIISPNFFTSNSPATTNLRRVSCAAVSPSSFYDVLGVSVAASKDEIKAAYRRMARSCHPDVAGNRVADDEFIRVRDAYSILSDPRKRADYDRDLFRIPRSSFSWSSAVSSSVVRVPRKNWESDQCW